MMGFIKKDLLLIKNNLKSILITIIIYFLFIMSNEGDASFILPFMMMIIIISTFNYDDFNKWNSYAITLPNGRKNLVKGKYLITILLILGTTLLGYILSFIIFKFQGKKDLIFSSDTYLSYLLAIFFMISILYPILFKYGAEKGRITMFIFSFIVFTVVGVISKLNFNVSNNFLLFLNNYGLYLFGGIVILMIIISYFISKKIIIKKEF